MNSPELTATASEAPLEAPCVRRGLLIVGPAFLAACLLEALVFGLVDPGEVHWPGHTVQPSRLGVYTLAFFSFWLISMASSALVLWLARPDVGPGSATGTK